MANAILVEGLRFAYPPTLPGVPAPWVLDGIDPPVGAVAWAYFRESGGGE
jgi:hypothetical protein